MSKKSHLEAALRLHIRASKIASKYEWIADKENRELFDGRRFRFDFRCDELKLAIECDGGLYTNGGHNRGGHIESTMEKYDIAQRKGWTVYVVGNKLINSGRAIETIEILIKLINDRMISK